LAQLYSAQGKYNAAESLYKQALAIHKKVLGPEHPRTSTTLNNLGFLYFKQGRYYDAEPLYQKSLAINEKVLGPEHPRTAITRRNLADLQDIMAMRYPGATL